MKTKPTKKELDFAYWWDIYRTPFRQIWETPNILKNGVTVKISLLDDMISWEKDYKRWARISNQIDSLREGNRVDDEGLLRKKEDELNTLGFQLNHKDSRIYKRPHMVFTFPLGMKKNRGGMKGFIDKGVALFTRQIGEI